MTAKTLFSILDLTSQQVERSKQHTAMIPLKIVGIEMALCDDTVRKLPKQI